MDTHTTQANEGLADFIRSDVQAILQDWDEFAKALLSGQHLHTDVLRDHAAELLKAIAEDMVRPQSLDAQEAKGKGLSHTPGSDLDSAACAHAVSRVMVHFSLPELIAEFRALRASVLRRWAAHRPGHPHLDEENRFNEAIDEALSISVGRFNSKLEASRDVILGVLAHDLRSPLSAAAMSAQFILRSNLVDANCLKSALMIQRSTMRMGQLIDDLLDYARTRLGDELPLKIQTCNLAVVCGEAVDEMQASHPGRSISYDFASDASCEGDPARIKQLLSNLLANALQHGDPQGPIQVGLRTVKDRMMISVHNSGPPVPLGRQTSIFQPLYVMKDHRPEDLSPGSSGLGLGLYISRQIAIAHGGDIELVSSLADGTTFTVWLPLTSPGTLR